MRDALLEVGFSIIVLYRICHNCRIAKFFQKMRHLVLSESINTQANVAGDVPLTTHWMLGYTF